jgi:uncharacterized protein (TIGR02646 family)
MRRIQRRALDELTHRSLRTYQTEVEAQRNDPAFNPTTFWQNRRNSQTILAVLGKLMEMAGVRQRCMYCVDSLGSDVDHFWPKASYHARMYVWENLLLCCTPCGRIKGNEFPLVGDQPLLIDPTTENPWDYLDFDSETGNIVPRVEPTSGEEAPKGRETVRVFQLDRREAIANGYKKTLRRIAGLVRRVIEEGQFEESVHELLEADDHGLLGWCFSGSGQNDSPFSDLRESRPEAWAAFQHAFS